MNSFKAVYTQREREPKLELRGKPGDIPRDLLF